MQRLSTAIEELKPHYEVLIIGSGYGGAINASRMARAGRRVALFERGQERHPGEYPNTELEGLREMQFNTPEGHLGSALGMFDFHLNESIDVVVGCGLGGTSLINANVSLRATPPVWDDLRWPEALRAHVPTLLEQGYQRAEEMLGAKPYPEHYPQLPKLSALETSAASIGHAANFYRPPINVTFEDGVNLAGVEQRACNNCGDCVSGCNNWAKNTVLMNYLPDAWNHGAEIFTETAVRYLEHQGDHWLIHFELLGEGRERFDAPLMFVKADMVILAAGTLGSTEIMLRSKAKGLELSEQVGQHMSGNGDVLAFAYDTEHPINSIGFGRHMNVADVGPCITGIIDLRDCEDWTQGFVIEEGSLPGLLAPSLPLTFGVAAELIGKEESHQLWQILKEKGRSAMSILRGSYHGAVHNSQTYLVMAHDGAKGQGHLQDDRLRLTWPNYGQEAIFSEVNEKLSEVSRVLGGTYIQDPIWTKLLNKSLVSVHPLGGCVMAEDGERGVVNHKGQVFRGLADEVYDNLYVSDGSIIPLSLGVNPLLTISALAERNAVLLAHDHGFTIDFNPSSAATKREVASTTLGIQFTETMRGFVSTEQLTDYQEAVQQGEAVANAMAFTLTIRSDNLDQLLAEPEHMASIVGTVEAVALAPEPLQVEQGSFKLFIDNPNQVETRNMVYDMVLRAESGEHFYFHGFKTVNPGSLAKAWPQTTTLYVTVYRGSDAQGELVAKGILHIKAMDFLKQMQTMRVTHATSETERLQALVRFGEFFAGTLFNAYGSVVRGPSYFHPDAPPRQRRPLRVSAPEFHPFETSDGLELLLTRYQGGNKGPVMLVHGAGVSSDIFATDLIDTNLLEYLYAHGYDVWLFDFRVSTVLPASEQASNGDEVAKIDHPEAVARVLALTGARSLQAVVHCYGSNTFFMSLLQGLEGVRSVVCSQVATNLVSPTVMRVKTGLHFPSLLDALGITSLSAYVDSQSNWKQKLFDDLLNLTSNHAEVGDSAVNERITFMYGQLFELEQLNEATYRNLHELFGVANMKTFEHLALMVRHQVLRSHDNQDIYMPHLERLAMPIRFIHGAKNRCYLPESTARTLALLQERNGAARYDRFVVEGYGHIDCIFGKNAVNDIYPLVLEHLERT